MLQSIRVLVALLILGIIPILAAPVSAAPIAPLTQTRFVSTSATIDPVLDEDSVVASDFLLFDESVSSSLNNGSSFASGNASQTSFFTEDGLEATGSVSTSGFFLGRGMGESRVEFVFDVVGSASYRLTGEVFGDDDATSVVSLRDSMGGYVEFLRHSEIGTGQGGTFDVTGALSSGNYTFSAGSMSCSDENPGCGQGAGSGSFAASLMIVPEPSTATLIGLGLMVMRLRVRRRA